MKIYSSALVCFIIVFLCTSFFSDKAVRYCNREYIQKKVNVYLKDEKINTLMMSIIDKKSKKPAFGYYINAIRNDTNFIHTKFENIGDTVVRKIYFDYKISHGRDSVISKFICKKNGLYFYSLQTYWNGELKKMEFPYRMLGE